MPRRPPECVSQQISPSALCPCLVYQGLKSTRPAIRHSQGAPMNDATRRVTHWIIGVRGDAPMVEDLATADDVHSLVCGHVRQCSQDGD
jgi:hypothetical protein